MKNLKAKFAAGATVVLLGGLGGVTLSQGVKAPSKPVADRPVVRTKVIRRTVHVTKHAKPKHPPAGAPVEPASAGAAVVTGSSGASESVPVTTGSSGSSGEATPVTTGSSGGGESESAPVTTGSSGSGENAPVTTGASGASGGGEVEREGGGGGDD